jgi:hypothetical protein
MSRNVNYLGVSIPRQTYDSSVELAEIVSRLNPGGLRSLAEETDRLASLTMAEGRDASVLGALSNHLRSRASRLEAQQTAN